MRRISALLPAALLAVGSAGCNNFLNADKAVSDPNSPSVATTNQLFVGAQANIFGEQEGHVAMTVCEWMQQCAGINGRFVDTEGTYLIDNTTHDFEFSNLYRGGGLVAIRTVEANSEAAGDKFYKGIAEVLEAMDISYGADIWGAIPYSEANGDNATPAFDSQMQIYASLQTLLDQAITDINGAGPGPGGFDLVYGNKTAANQKKAWIEAAHTLKARLYLHTVEKVGSNTPYTSALAQAQLGILDSTDDWKTLHGTGTTEKNLWAQFQISSFGNDLVAGSTLVNLMIAQNDPRLAEYFGKNSVGGYGGYDVTLGNTPPTTISQIAGSGRTNNGQFRQPVLTYDETQLIIAEAQFKLGNVAAAAAALNAVKVHHGKATIATPTLADIMNEKYISLFQNVETWSDFKRTCLPALKPARSKTVIPGRLYYGSTEEQTNTNTPASDEQNLITVRNENDPAACPAS